MMTNQFPALNQTANTPTQPWSALQRDAKDLGETPDHLMHIDGIRRDILEDAAGELMEKGDFSDAFINPAKVKDVYLCIKPFADQPKNLPGHALFNFEFEPDAPVTFSDGTKDKGLAVSVEAHFHQGEKYDPKKHNPVVHQLGTWNDALEKANVYDHDDLQTYRLNLSHDTKVALLTDRLRAATADHSNDLYDAQKNSCLSNVVDAINKVVPPEQQIPRLLPDGTPDPSAAVPVWCANTFLAHGLLAQNHPDIYPMVPNPHPAPPPTLPPGFPPDLLQG